MVLITSFRGTKFSPADFTWFSSDWNLFLALRLDYRGPFHSLRVSVTFQTAHHIPRGGGKMNTGGSKRDQAAGTGYTCVFAQVLTRVHVRVHVTFSMSMRTPCTINEQWKSACHRSHRKKASPSILTFNSRLSTTFKCLHWYLSMRSLVLIPKERQNPKCGYDLDHRIKIKDVWFFLTLPPHCKLQSVSRWPLASILKEGLWELPERVGVGIRPQWHYWARKSPPSDSAKTAGNTKQYLFPV